MNTIRIEFSPEDRARLDRIAALLEGLDMSKTLEVTTTVEVESSETAQDEPVAEPEENVNPADETRAEAAPEPVVTLEQIRQRVVDLSRTGKKDETRKVVMNYGAKVSDIPTDKYVEVMERLNALQEG